MTIYEYDHKMIAIKGPSGNESSIKIIHDNI